jgi:hypothetical protein
VGSFFKFLGFRPTSLQFLGVLRRERRRILLLKAMNTETTPVDDIPSFPDTDESTTPISEPWTPLIRSGETSPDSEVIEDPVVTAQKKKKKKKPKKSAKAKEAAALKAKAQAAEDAESRPTVLCISRNKHWRYISSYHVGTIVAVLFPY